MLASHLFEMLASTNCCTATSRHLPSSSFPNSLIISAIVSMTRYGSSLGLSQPPGISFVFPTVNALQKKFRSSHTDQTCQPHPQECFCLTCPGLLHSQRRNQINQFSNKIVCYVCWSVQPAEPFQKESRCQRHFRRSLSKNNGLSIVKNLLLEKLTQAKSRQRTRQRRQGDAALFGNYGCS